MVWSDWGRAPRGREFVLNLFKMKFNLIFSKHCFPAGCIVFLPHLPDCGQCLGENIATYSFKGFILNLRDLKKLTWILKEAATGKTKNFLRVLKGFKENWHLYPIVARSTSFIWKTFKKLELTSLILHGILHS